MTEENKIETNVELKEVIQNVQEEQVQDIQNEINNAEKEQKVKHTRKPRKDAVERKALKSATEKKALKPVVEKKLLAPGGNNLKRERLKIIPLGGLEEVGKNMTVFEYGNDMFLLDCGVAFPEDDLLGVDLVIPDITYLQKNKSKLN